MEPLALLVQTAPFDTLTKEQLECAAAAAAMAPFRAGDRLLAEGESPAALRVVIQGAVQAILDGREVERIGAGGSFDVEALLRQRSACDYVACEDGACLVLPRAVFLELLTAAPEFADQCFQDIAERVAGERSKQINRDLAGFMVAKIADAYIHPRLQVPASTSIHDAARTMRDNHARSLLVDRDGAIGICSGTDLRDAVVVARRSPDDPVGDIASYDLIALDADDFLFNALLTMTRHDISRVAIRRGDAIVGVLEQIDLLSYLSSHSRLIAVRIEQATTRAELEQASRDLVDVIEALHVRGVKQSYIGELLAELNKKLFAKLFGLIAPPELIANSCLIVMGSEGRREQILKTDQDNALLLRDGFAHPEIERVTHEFTEALVAFGYPRCPGNIMVSNPYWTRSVSAFRDEIFNWIQWPTEESFMQFAIFVDARAVAGDSGLLEELRQYVFARLQSSSPFYAKFARATEAFETPLGMFSNFVMGKAEHRDALDLKKGGIFPLTHGVRSLALEHRIEATNTLERIAALQAKGVLTESFAIELGEALTMLSTLRLTTGLQKIKAGLPQDNYVQPNKLNKLERELLRDSFKIVNEFKKFISFHFKLNLIT